MYVVRFVKLDELWFCTFVADVWSIWLVKALGVFFRVPCAKTAT